MVQLPLYEDLLLWALDSKDWVISVMLPVDLLSISYSAPVTSSISCRRPLVSQAARFFFAGSSTSMEISTAFPALLGCAGSVPVAGVVLRDRVVALVVTGCEGPALDLAGGTARGRPPAGTGGVVVLVALPAAVIGPVLPDVKGALAVVGLGAGVALPVCRVCACSGALLAGLAGGGC